MLVVLVLASLTVWAFAAPAGGPSGSTPPRAAVSASASAGSPDAQARPGPSKRQSGRDAAVVANTCPPEAVACVDTRLRLAWLQQHGRRIYGPVPIMPGTPGAGDAVATPSGNFQVEWKDPKHRSSEYHEAMPHAVFFAPGGIAFHQGSLLDSSHGCVHLSAAAAARFYRQLPVGATVAVFHSPRSKNGG